MQRHNTMWFVASAVGALVVGIIGIYAGLIPTTFNRDDNDRREVEAIVERYYQHPSRHTLTRAIATGNQRGFVEWVRHYDSVEMESKVISLHGANGLEVRMHRELREPELVRRNDLVSFAQAADKAGLGEAFARGQIKARLVFRPVFTLPEDKNDSQLVVERYQLVIELQADTYARYVDAYSGTPLGRVESTQQ